MLDTNICIYVMKNLPPTLRDRFNTMSEQICISSVTLGEPHYGVETSARRTENLSKLEHFAARLVALPFDSRAAAHYGQMRSELERKECRAAHTICRSAHMHAARDSWS